MNRIQKVLVGIFAAFVLFLASLYFGGFSSYTGTRTQLQLSSPKSNTGVLAPGATVTQHFMTTERELARFAVYAGGGAPLRASYSFSQGDAVLLTGELDTGDELIELIASPLAVTSGLPVTLTITALEGNAAGLYYGDTIKLARGESQISGLTQDTCVYLNDQVLYGRLSGDALAATYQQIGTPFLLISAALIVLALIWLFYELKCDKNGKGTFVLRAANAIQQYWFVISQMVARDFKAKYKRSVLGVFWSFLNPLLTMGIQYVVFSTIFKSEIAYFPVYLMAGSVCFSFFSESTSMGLSSITDNAALLKKVYVPKYIFTLSRVLSSGINFLFSLIPLFAMVLISGLPITPAYLLLFFVMLCLFIFCMGVSFLLATIMVFFQDIKFLWGVFVTLLMYVTPLFYPESILPASMLSLVKLNPLYHVIRFLRAILIDGISPEPKAYLLCFISCLIPLVLGAFVFKRHQDRFIMNI